MDVVVVAGGRSRRLGEDKAVLRRGAGRQVDHVVAALRRLGGDVIVAPGHRPLAVDGARGVEDVAGMVGPLAGVVAGLLAATSDLVAVVGVDLVQPDADLFRGLARHVTANHLAGAMPLVDGRPQPLHAVVRRAIAGDLRGAGDRLVAAFRQVGVVEVEPGQWQAWAPTARPADDLDTPADLAALRADGAT